MPRACYGLAALAGAHAVLLLASSRELPVLLLAAAQGAVLAGFLLVGWLAGTRRLPAWRREAALAVLLLVAVAVCGVRAAALNQPGQLAELAVLTLVGAALLGRPPWTWGVLTAGPAAWAGALAVRWLAFSGSPGATLPTDQLMSWAEVGLATVAGAVLGAGLQVGRSAWTAAMSAAQVVAAEQAVRDPLTGVANRRGLEMVALPMLEHARRDGQAVHCLVVDVDGLRSVNEAVGSRGGDEVLLTIAASLRGSSRTTDVVARWGADQFVLIGPGTGTSPLEMERRIRSLVKQTPPVPQQIWSGQVSVGSATLVPWDDGDLGSLLGRAESDMALRRSLRRKADAARQGGGQTSPVTRAAQPADD